MAEELRCVTIKGNMTSGPAVEDNIANFQNGGGRDISIRKVDLGISGNGMNAGDSAQLELSMDPTILSNVNGDQTKRVVTGIRAPEQTTASTTSGGHFNSKLESFAKGQWILEPGDDLHLNVSKTTTTSGQVDCQVWYHFN